MNKETIKDLIIDKNKIYDIIRRIWGFDITDDLFFRIFINIIEYKSDITVIVMKPSLIDRYGDYLIIFTKDNQTDKLEISYNKQKLLQKIDTYNQSQPNIRLEKGVDMLINIFTDLLE